MSDKKLLQMVNKAITAKSRLNVEQLDEITSFIRSQNIRGCAVLMVVFPAPTPEAMKAPTQISVYGNYANIGEQVEAMRMIADKIENSEAAHEELPGVN